MGGFFSSVVSLFLVLDVSRIEQGQLELTLEPLDLGELVGLMVDRVRAAVRPTLRFEVQIACPLCQVPGDRIRLE